jgi:hypothetical protein
MNQALEALRAKNTADVTLPSGLTVTGTLPRVRDCLIGGDIPLPVLVEIEKRTKATNGDKAPDLSADEIRAVGTFNDNLVLAFVTHLEGEPVELEPDDLAVFEEDDFNEIVLYASRAKPLPGKD